MIIPTIHRNGTSATEIRSQLEEFYAALREAIVKGRNASPNARDYYPQGNLAFDAARKAHEERLAKISSVRDEIMALWEAIEDQIDKQVRR